MSRLFHRLGARAIRATLFVDRAFLRFDQARSLVITALASDGVLEAYNDLTYGATPVYNADSATFRSRLFNWEADLVARVFPEPPARILIGGAGGGREAFDLAARGYQVTAFEPSLVLARSMRARVEKTGAAVEPLLGRYETLPRLRCIDTDEEIDLAQREPYDAAMLGWSSFSHIRTSSARIATLKAFAGVTKGPIAVSFFLAPDTSRPHHWISRLTERWGLRSGGDSFTPHIGFFHLSSKEELAAEVEAAGLEVVDVSYDDTDGHWPWIAVRSRRQGSSSGSMSD